MAKKIEGFKISAEIGWIPYMIGGSYLVNQVHANDIDLIVHEYHKDDLQRAIGHKENWRTLRAEDGEKYDQIDKMRLHEVWEGFIDGQKFNILVVGATFWPAYQGACNALTARPDLYVDRDARIALHRDLCKIVGKIAGVLLEDHQY